MFNAIIESIFISLICNGIYILFKPDNILGFIGKSLIAVNDNYINGHWFARPLGLCIGCMASLYGIIIHVCLMQLGLGVSIELLLPVLIVSIYLNKLFYAILQKLEAF